ncbi:uncharacterized protein LOC112188317 isoform X2 [Rosa chinensis]|uniref:uncharacterized protein LOC112188317 isoform X2 n=1 Tax=Rosa chinensis TaxID=74649 RepID=UPI000D0963BD|nr:uncharacterized protein LOC112188317 isoform X2 [Rosa chinensis]
MTERRGERKKRRRNRKREEEYVFISGWVLSKGEIRNERERREESLFEVNRQELGFGLVSFCGTSDFLKASTSGSDYLFTGSCDGTLKRWVVAEDAANSSATFESHVDWEHGTLKEALDIVQFAHNRNVQILYPKSFCARMTVILSNWKYFLGMLLMVHDPSIDW